MKLLHLDSSILGGNSASRQLSAAIVDQLAKATPGLDIVYRDLAAEPLLPSVGRTFRRPPGRVPESPAIQKDIAASQAVLDEFLGADIVVIGAPMYNFGIPSQLKAWIDRIARGRQDLPLRRRRPRGPGRQQARHRRHFARRPLWRGHAGRRFRTCGILSARACSALSASPTWRSSLPKAWRLGPNSAKKRCRAHCRPSRNCLRPRNCVPLETRTLR